MTAYYNEIEPFAADWLRRLIARGLIAPGDVDTRSIVDVQPDDLRSYAQCHFFAGIGGWSYALRSAGWDDARPVWTGSCPCQPFSLAGKQKGFDDARHLWPVWRELIRECDPAVVFGEQVASATEWLGLVRGDLEAMGRAVGSMPIQAASAGAHHLRDRYWFVAHTDRQRRQVDQNAGGSSQRGGARKVTGPNRFSDVHLVDAISERGCGRHAEWQDAAHADASSESRHLGNTGGTGARRDGGSLIGSQAKSGCEWQIDGDLRQPAIVAGSALDWVVGADGKTRPVKPGLCLLAHGVSGRVGKLRGFGNAIDPRPAKEFIGAFIDVLAAQASSHGGGAND